jgi:hypothetical protein
MEFAYYDGFVRSLKNHISVIPAKAGIQFFDLSVCPHAESGLAERFR